MAKVNVKSLLGVSIAVALLAVIFVPFSDAASVFGAKGDHGKEKPKQHAVNSVLAANLDKKVDSHDNKIAHYVKQVIDKKLKTKHNQENGGGTSEDQEYVLTAKGVATDKPIGNSVDGYSYSAIPAELKMDLDLWKSTKLLSILKIAGGTIELGDESHEIESGYLVFRPSSHKITAYAFIDDGDEYGNHITLLKIQAKTPTGTGLPDEEGDPAIEFEIQSPQSKIVPGIFLKMNGEIKLA